MQVVEEINGNIIPEAASKHVVIDFSAEHGLIEGYVPYDTPVKYVYFRDNGEYPVVPSLFGEDNIVFSNKKGTYIVKSQYTPYELFIESHVKGVGRFPYRTLSRNYEAIESFRIFDGAQEIIQPKEYLLPEFFPYTFGLEFETSQGYIPEDICYRDGLIPLRDGSIKGIEYSTVVLNGNEGLCLLEQQVNTLREYTWFDKECALHVHIGNYPLDQEAIYNLYLVCKGLEESLEQIVPTLTFRSYLYKENGKDYCKKLPSLRNFNQLYEYFVGRKFYGSFTQSHPNDIGRNAKWRIQTRYFWCNFINLLCYKVNKTIEFRLLRPSYNLEKIVLWLYIFNAILQYAEKYIKAVPLSRLTLNEVLVHVYPPEIVDRLKIAIAGLQVVKATQRASEDEIGNDTAIENNIFTGNFGIIYK